MRTAITIALTLLLAAFSPPDRSPAPLKPTQQQAIPKSWIPDQKLEQAPPVVLEAVPRPLSAYTHLPGQTCEQPPTGPALSARPFVEAYAGAMTALRQTGDFSEVIRLAEVATAYAKDAREWTAIEQIRIEAFTRLGNDFELVASLEAALSRTGCLSPEHTANYVDQLEAARSRLNAPH